MLIILFSVINIILLHVCIKNITAAVIFIKQRRLLANVCQFGMRYSKKRCSKIIMQNRLDVLCLLRSLTDLELLSALLWL